MNKDLVNEMNRLNEDYVNEINTFIVIELSAEKWKPKQIAKILRMSKKQVLSIRRAEKQRIKKRKREKQRFFIPLMRSISDVGAL
jgi:predicted RNA-binding protein with RPS1 domain